MQLLHSPRTHVPLVGIATSLTLLPFLAFTASLHASPVITVLAPAAGVSGGSPVFFEAYATSPGCAAGIASMRINSSPGANDFSVAGAHIEHFFTLDSGSYSASIEATDNCGSSLSKAIDFAVHSAAGISVYLPHQPSASGPIHIAASAQSPSCAKGIAAMRFVSASGITLYHVYANTADAYVTLPPGANALTLKAWDNCGGVFNTPLNTTVTTSPDAWLYARGLNAGGQNVVEELTVESDGSLSNPGGASTAPQFSFPGGQVVVDPGGWFAYGASYSGGICAYQIDRSNGALRPISGSPYAFNVASLGDQEGPTLFMDPTGNFVMVVYHGAYGGQPAGIAAYRINRSTGALSFTGSMLTFGSASSGYGAASQPVTNPVGRFLYVSATESTSTPEKLHGYEVDMDTGALDALPGSPFPFLEGGLSATTGNFLYSGVALSQSEGEVSGLELHPTSGGMTVLAGSPYAAGTIGPSLVWTDAQGRYLWAWEYASGTSTKNGLQVFTIDPSTGALTLSGTLAELPAAQSFTLAEDSTGNYVFTGIQNAGSGTSDDLVSWSIRSNGMLEPITSLDILNGDVVSVAVVPGTPQ